MTKRMLIDASHPEETRVVVLDGNRIEEFDLETATRRALKGNIYLAKVVRVEPSLQAAFVEYGGNRHGFLAFGEIHPDYYQIPVADRQRLIEMQAEDARAEEEADMPPRIRHGPRRLERRGRRGLDQWRGRRATARPRRADCARPTPPRPTMPPTRRARGDADAARADAERRRRRPCRSTWRDDRITGTPDAGQPARPPTTEADAAERASTPAASRRLAGDEPPAAARDHRRRGPARRDRGRAPRAPHPAAASCATTRSRK